MSRKHRKPDAAKPIVEIKSVQAEVVAVARLVPASAAGECCMCKALREQAGKKNYTEIYCTRGPIRYCRCLVCKHTWKVIG